MMEQYTTETDRPSARLRIWNEIASANWAGVAISAKSSVFEGTLTHMKANDVHYARVISSQAEIHRRGRVGKAGQITLHFQKRGNSRNQRGAVESSLSAGDLTFFRSTDDYCVELSDGNEMLVADFDEALIGDRIGTIDVRSGSCLAAQSRPTRLVGSLMDGLLEVDSNIDSAAAAIVENSFLELLVLLLGPAAGDRQPNASLYRKSMLFIEDRLRDPELRTSMVADELSVSERAVQQAFAARNETPSMVILDKRLDLAAKDLLRDHSATITDIAFNAGLSSSSYFARCFRRRFGMTPRYYRSKRAPSLE